MTNVKWKCKKDYPFRIVFLFLFHNNLLYIGDRAFAVCVAKDHKARFAFLDENISLAFFLHFGIFNLCRVGVFRHYAYLCKIGNAIFMEQILYRNALAVYFDFLAFAVDTDTVYICKLKVCKCDTRCFPP